MIIPGMEEIPFVQTWTQVLKKRGILTLIWIAGAAIVAGIIVLLFFPKKEGCRTHPPKT